MKSMYHQDGISHGQLAKMNEEVAEQLKLGMQRHNPKRTLMNKEVLENSCPTQQDGLPKEKVALWHRQICTMLQRAGMNLRIPQWGIGMAMFLTQRFFRRKSMRRNDRFVVAMACLHLAAKIEDSPKSIKDVVKESIRTRYSYLGEQEVASRLQRMGDLEQHKDEILVAERAVLYTLGFDLNAQHPYSFLVNRLSALGLLQANTQEGNPFKMLMQNTWNFTNDSFRTTLCLQYPPETIAYGALYMAHRLNLEVFPNSSLEILLKEKTQDPTMTFFKFFEIKPEDIAEVQQQIKSVYKQSRTATIQQQQQQQVDAAQPPPQQQQSPAYFAPSPAYTHPPLTPTPASLPPTPSQQLHQYGGGFGSPKYEPYSDPPGS